MFELRDRVAFVTGAAQGIGRAIAEVLAEAGARIVAVNRQVEKLDELAARIQAAGGDALAVGMDVAKEEDIKAAFAQAMERFGRVDILVNNAGIARDQIALRMKREEWDAVLETNLTGAYLCAQQALRSMLRQQWGRIINITSVVAQIGNPGQVNYISSKAGLIGLTKALAVEVASRNITVNAVAPGFIVTPMTEGLPEKVRTDLIARIPLGRMGTDREIAHGVLFLASEEACYITGHVLDINGGLYLA
jgi:3-oxoacyl-[acyl-carrier protein] reductase